MSSSQVDTCSGPVPCIHSLKSIVASAGSKANIREALDVEPSHPAVCTNLHDEEAFRAGSRIDTFDFQSDSPAHVTSSC